MNYPWQYKSGVAAWLYTDVLYLEQSEWSSVDSFSFMSHHNSVACNRFCVSANRKRFYSQDSWLQCLQFKSVWGTTVETSLPLLFVPMLCSHQEVHCFILCFFYLPWKVLLSVRKCRRYCGSPFLFTTRELMVKRRDAGAQTSGCPMKKKRKLIYITYRVLKENEKQIVSLLDRQIRVNVRRNVTKDGFAGLVFWVKFS